MSAIDYLRLSASDLGNESRIPILKLGDSGEVFYEMALQMLDVIKQNNAGGKHTVLICPVGPTGQYPIFTRLVNQMRISLKNCWFLNMDEYLDADDNWIDIQDPLSFRGFMRREVYDTINPELLMPDAQRIFPDPADITRIPKLIETLGGVDAVFGGIGINGHIAFNEPRPELKTAEFARLPTRILDIAPETRAINAAGALGGALDAMPKRCITIGMSEILGAKKIRLGIFREWHRAAVRQAGYGKVSPAFPATLLQNHPDALIISNAAASVRPY